MGQLQPRERIEWEVLHNGRRKCTATFIQLLAGTLSCSSSQNKVTVVSVVLLGRSPLSTGLVLVTFTTSYPWPMMGRYPPHYRGTPL